MCLHDACERALWVCDRQPTTAPTATATNIAIEACLSTTPTVGANSAVAAESTTGTCTHHQDATTCTATAAAHTGQLARCSSRACIPVCTDNAVNMNQLLYLEQHVAAARSARKPNLTLILLSGAVCSTTSKRKRSHC